MHYNRPDQLMSLSMNKPHYVFIDSVAPYAYAVNDLYHRAMGGTEATVLRVTKALSQVANITIAQSARTDTVIDEYGICYTPYYHKHCSHYQADAIIVIRAHKLLPKLRRYYPHSRMLLWMHCFPGMRLRDLAQVTVATTTTVIAVSKFHQQWMQDFYEQHDPEAAMQMKMQTIYNPVDTRLQNNHQCWDPNKLLFMSSPHKGLDQVLQHFKRLREELPSLRLYIANPGYLDWQVAGMDDSVEILGALSHAEVIEHLRTALCLFYPQSQFEETFGIVFAEAMAVGTPTLTHAIGAAPEVLGVNEQLCDANDFNSILTRIRQWQKQRYAPSLPAAFTIKKVIQAWQTLLAAPKTTALNQQVGVVANPTSVQQTSDCA